MAESKPIVWFDPGEHVGIAWRNPDGTLDAKMLHFDLPNTYAFITKPPHPKIVGFEDFETAGNISKAGLYTVRVVGGIQALCLHYNIPCVLQIPQARYAFRTEAANILTAQRKSSRKWVVHEMDALAHLLAFEQRQANEYRRASLVTNKGATTSKSVSRRSVSTSTTLKDRVLKLRRDSNLLAPNK